MEFANSYDFDNTIHFPDYYDNVYMRTTHRVRKALFPEILLEDDVNENNYDSNSSSVVSQFAEPSVILKEAILNLLSLREQLDNNANNIANLTQLLRHSDSAIVLDAAQKIYLLSKKDNCVAQFASNQNLINTLIETLSLSNNDEVKKNVVAVLSYISNYPNGRMHIFRSGGIAGLIQMLQSTIEAIVHYAVTTLHNLLLCVPDAKTEIIACSGLEAFVPLLGTLNPKLQALVADCLYFLLLDEPLSKQTFLSLQGPHYLLSILQSNTSYLKLIYAVVRCIRSISTDQRNKLCLISLKGLETLHQILPIVHDAKRKLAVLNAMRNLSDVATNLDTLSGLVVDLVTLINTNDDEETVICVCGILSNLTCNNTRNKQAVCSTNGIIILADVLHRFSNVEDITEPTLCTLRHCTVRHPMAQKAQDQLCAHHSVILNLLATRRSPIIKAALGLIRNCALSQINLQLIISKKTPEGDSVVTIAAEILEQAGFELQKNFNAVTDGVSLLELVEGAISALHQLAKDPYIAQFIFNHVNIMNILINLMAQEQISNNEDELMMREIMGLIYQLTKSPEGAKALKLYGPEPYIFDALDSFHKPVAAYASIILKNLGINKPIEYNQRNYNCVSGTLSNQTGYQQTDQNNSEMGWQNDGMEPELYNELYNCPSLGELRNDHMGKNCLNLGELKNDHIEKNVCGTTWCDTDL